jgi:hypothetical protein
MRANRYLTAAWGWMREFAHDIHQAKEAHDVYSKLNRLDDTRLGELGLKRHDLACVAFNIMTRQGEQR